MKRKQDFKNKQGDFMCNKNLKIDTEKCIHCGLCVKDCMAKSLEFDENKIPQFASGGEKRCIQCQHCLAVCPTGALSILGKNPENSEPVKNAVNPDDLLNLIKSRRSFRYYKKENLNPEIMDKLKDMTAWVPTGVNNHKLIFSFIDDIEVMDNFREKVTKKLIKLLSNPLAKPIADKFSRYKDAMINGEDIIFRGAPHIVAVSSPINAPCAQIDPIIALSYFELYAQSMGVATVWCGLAEICLQLFPELYTQLEIPENYKPYYVMLFGPADIKYTRTTQPEPYKIISVNAMVMTKWV